jgi:hypothetical protein
VFLFAGDEQVEAAKSEKSFDKEGKLVLNYN